MPKASLTVAVTQLCAELGRRDGVLGQSRDLLGLPRSDRAVPGGAVVDEVARVRVRRAARRIRRRPPGREELGPEGWPRDQQFVIDTRQSGVLAGRIHVSVPTTLLAVARESTRVAGAACTALPARAGSGR